MNPIEKNIFNITCVVLSALETVPTIHRTRDIRNSKDKETKAAIQQISGSGDKGASWNDRQNGMLAAGKDNKQICFLFLKHSSG
jgi:hypothetical protein